MRSIAELEGISYQQLDTINGSGLNGRITKRDILGFLKTKSRDSVKREELKTDRQNKKKSETKQEIPHEIKPMGRVRKLIAQHMVKSVQTAPHVTSFVEIDVTKLVQWRSKTKQDFLQREGEKLTFTPIFIEAAVKALKDFPQVNVSLENDTIVHHKEKY